MLMEAQKLTNAVEVTLPHSDQQRCVSIGSLENPGINQNGKSRRKAYRYIRATKQSVPCALQERNVIKTRAWQTHG